MESKPCRHKHTKDSINISMRPLNVHSWLLIEWNGNSIAWRDIWKQKTVLKTHYYRLSMTHCTRKWRKSWSNFSYDARTFHINNWISANACKQCDRMRFALHLRPCSRCNESGERMMKIQIVGRRWLIEVNVRHGKAMYC